MSTLKKKNVEVLDIVSGYAKRLKGDADDDDDDTPSEEEYGASQPVAKKTKKQDNQATTFLTHLLSQQPHTVKTQQKVKPPPANVNVIVQQNIDLFRRAIEAKQNNQFELVNENIRHLTTIVANHINESNKNSRQVCKTISNLKECVDEVYHAYSNNSNLAKQKAALVQFKSSLGANNSVTSESSSNWRI